MEAGGAKHAHKSGLRSLDIPSFSRYTIRNFIRAVKQKRFPLFASESEPGRVEARRDERKPSRCRAIGPNDFNQ